MGGGTDSQGGRTTRGGLTTSGGRTTRGGQTTRGGERTTRGKRTTRGGTDSQRGDGHPGGGGIRKGGRYKTISVWERWGRHTQVVEVDTQKMTDFALCKSQNEGVRSSPKFQYDKKLHDLQLQSFLKLSNFELLNVSASDERKYYVKFERKIIKKFIIHMSPCVYYQIDSSNS